MDGYCLTTRGLSKIRVRGTDFRVILSNQESVFTQRYSIFVSLIDKKCKRYLASTLFQKDLKSLKVRPTLLCADPGVWMVTVNVKGLNPGVISKLG